MHSIVALESAFAPEALPGHVREAALHPGDAPIRTESEGFAIETLRAPLSGRPDSLANIENIAWRAGAGTQAPRLSGGGAELILESMRASWFIRNT